mgnify:FL=1
MQNLATDRRGADTLSEENPLMYRVNPELLAAYTAAAEADDALLARREKIELILIEQMRAGERTFNGSVQPAGDALAVLLGEEPSGEEVEAPHRTFRNWALVDRCREEKQNMIPLLNASAIALSEAKTALIEGVVEEVEKEYFESIQSFKTSLDLMGTLNAFIDEAMPTMVANISPKHLSEGVNFYGARRGTLSTKSTMSNMAPSLFRAADMKSDWARKGRRFKDELFGA